MAVEGEVYKELMNLLTNLLICRDSKDSRIWKPSASRKFLAKYLALEGNRPHRAPSSNVCCLGLVPPWVETYCWLVVTVKVFTVDNLRRRRMTSSNIINICVMCG